MNAFIKKLTSSFVFQDTVALLRGVYRVGEGINPLSSANSVRTSWMENSDPHQGQQTTEKQTTEKEIPKQEEQK
jgi:hypothetical protein